MDPQKSGLRKTSQWVGWLPETPVIEKGRAVPRSGTVYYADVRGLGAENLHSRPVRAQVGPFLLILGALSLRLAVPVFGPRRGGLITVYPSLLNGQNHDETCGRNDRGSIRTGSAVLGRLWEIVVEHLSSVLPINWPLAHPPVSATTGIARDACRIPPIWDFPDW